MDVARRDGIHEFWREMQPRCGGGYGTVMGSEHGLIVFVVGLVNRAQSLKVDR